MLKMHNVRVKHSKKEAQALFIEDLSFQDDEFVAIIGPSGAGKTTFLKTLLKANFSQEGEIIWKKQKLFELNHTDLRKHRLETSYLSQKPFLIDHDTVYLNIKRSLTEDDNWLMKIFHFVSKRRYLKIFYTLKDLGIHQQFYTPVAELSGGQQQRVNIAKILLNHQQLILADEPIASLDPQTAKTILLLIKEAALKNSALTLVNLHNIEFLKLEKVFTHVLAIKNGKILFKKTIHEWNEGFLKEVYQ